MEAFISYSEISAYLNKKVNMGFSFSFISSDKLRISFSPHKLIGQVSADVRFFMSPEGEVSLAAEGGSPGVDSIISGITTMMTGKTSPLPYLVFSGKHVKINLAKIPQLSKLFYVVSSPSLTATANGLKITVNI